NYNGLLSLLYNKEVQDEDTVKAVEEILGFLENTMINNGLSYDVSKDRKNNLKRINLVEYRPQENGRGRGYRKFSLLKEYIPEVKEDEEKVKNTPNVSKKNTGNSPVLNDTKPVDQDINGADEKILGGNIDGKLYDHVALVNDRPIIYVAE